MSSLRSEIVPPHIGSTLLAMFRLPLNVLVIAILVNLEALGESNVRRPPVAECACFDFLLGVPSQPCLVLCALPQVRGVNIVQYPVALPI